MVQVLLVLLQTLLGYVLAHILGSLKYSVQVFGTLLLLCQRQVHLTQFVHVCVILLVELVDYLGVGWLQELDSIQVVREILELQDW